MLGISSLLSSALTTPTPILLSLPSLKSRASSQCCTIIKTNLKIEMRRFRTPFRLRTWTVVVQMRWNAKKSERCYRHSANSCSNRPCLIQILDNSYNGHVFSRPLKKLARDQSFSSKIFRDFAFAFSSSSRIRVSFHLMNLSLCSIFDLDGTGYICCFKLELRGEKLRSCWRWKKKKKDLASRKSFTVLRSRKEKVLVVVKRVKQLQLL